MYLSTLSRTLRKTVTILTVFLASFTFLTTQAQPSDWHQWRGPNRNGLSAETGWQSKWSPPGPRRVWQVRVGQGYSGVAVVGNKAYTLGNANGQDTLFCLNTANGNVIWQYKYNCASGDYGGPRATPAVSKGKVYLLSREGLAICLDASSGKFEWQQHVGQQVGVSPPTWGFAGSPLVEGNRVYYNIGPNGIALDATSGKVVWKSGRGGTGYSSPLIATIGTQKTLVLFNADGVIGVNPDNGRTIWFHPWKTSYDVNAADPLVVGNEVFISSNYGKGCALLRIDGNRVSVVWENRSMKNHFNPSVLVNGHLFGNDDNTLRCVQWKTGTEKWSLRGIDKGGVIAADWKLIVLSGRGEVIIAEAKAERYTELARIPVLNGTTWTHPTLANGFLYCRSHEGELVCLDLRAKK